MDGPPLLRKSPPTQRGNSEWWFCSPHKVWRNLLPRKYRRFGRTSVPGISGTSVAAPDGTTLVHPLPKTHPSTPGTRAPGTPSRERKAEVLRCAAGVSSHRFRRLACRHYSLELAKHPP